MFGLRNLIKNKAYTEALSECAATPGPVARVIHSAIRRYSSPRSELREIVQESGQLEVPKLEKHLSVLLTVAYIAPLIGLLGSVLGLVDTFVQINAVGGFATVSEISQGVYEALITSAAGAHGSRFRLSCFTPTCVLPRRTSCTIWKVPGLKS